ncbi:hydrogenase maturation nickel metallochaperone HypA [Eubacteriales bacterium KG127]
MHELGVVFHILDDLKEVAAENNVKKVNKVTLQLGEVSTIIPSYLTDCFRWAADKEELFKGAELEIEKIDAITHCDGCGGDYPTVEHGKKCPVCGSENTWLLQGTEFMIKEIEAE